MLDTGAIGQLLFHQPVLWLCGNYVPCWYPPLRTCPWLCRLTLDRRYRHTPGKVQLPSSSESLWIFCCDDSSTPHDSTPKLAQRDKKLLSYKHLAVLWFMWVALRQDVCCLVQAVRLHTKLKEEPWDCAGHGPSSQDSWNNSNKICVCLCWWDMKVCSAVPQDTLAKCSVNMAIVLQRRLGLLQYGCDRDMPSSVGIDMFISIKAVNM